jgi:hypothetical protein
MKMRLMGHAVCMTERRNGYRILVWESEGKRPILKPRRKCHDNIKMGLKKDVTKWVGFVSF